MDNCFLVDWLTFSAFDLDLETAILSLGMSHLKWEVDLPSKLRYAKRAACGGISIHYTSPFMLETYPEKRYNPGVCFEMSGKGCREYETYGKGDFDYLIWGILDSPAYRQITRLDIAYDDFDGLIDIRHMAAQAMEEHYTSRLQNCDVTFSRSGSGHDKEGITVAHGARSSRLYIRCYDKRVERKAWDLEHWVRLELQFRDEDAMGVARALVDKKLGEVFAGVLQNYLTYRDCVSDDSNKSRWPVSEWWQRLIGAVAPLQVYEKKTVEYNREKLDQYVFGQCRNAIKTSIALYGMYDFAEKVAENTRSLPRKYVTLLEQAGINSQKILEELAVYDG